MLKKLPFILFIGLFSLFLQAQTITEFSTGYSSPEGIAVDSNNNVFVTELFSGNIYELDATGTQTLFATTGFRAHDIAFDSNDNLFVAEPFNGKILAVDASGTVSDYVVDFNSSPYGLDFDNDLLYYASENNAKVIQINSDLSTTDYATGFFTPEGIAFDSNGNLFIADRNDRILFKVTPSGTKTTIASNIDNIRGIAVAPNDDVYFTKYKTFPEENKIIKYQAATGTISDFITTNLDQPRSIAIDNLGNMYVVNAGSSSIVQIYDVSLLPPSNPTIVNIPDANFKAALVNSTTINSNGDTEIQFTEAEAFTLGINVNNLNISDLTGIEAFTEITSLNCSNNQLTTLDVSANTSLTQLLCTDNDLTQLNTSSNTNLTTLWCQRNDITSLDLVANTMLDQLSSQNNQLTELDLTNNTLLTFIGINNNLITDIDLSFNTILNFLRINNNNLTTLDLSDHIQLSVLDCTQNNLASIDLAANINLTDLNAGSNPNISAIDLSTNTLLEKLALQSLDLLTELDLSNNTALVNLLCSSTALTSIDLRNGNNLNMTNFSVLNANSLTCVFVDDKDYSIANWTNPNPGTTYFVETEAECSDATLTISDVQTSGFKLFPNPVKDLLNIESNTPFDSLFIYDLQGKKLLESTNASIDVKSLSKGMYIIKVLKNQNVITYQRFIKK